MSLHLDQQCQRAQKTDALAYPLLEGDPGAWFLVTEKRTVWPTAAVTPN